PWFLVRRQSGCHAGEEEQGGGLRLDTHFIPLMANLANRTWAADRATSRVPTPSATRPRWPLFQVNGSRQFALAIGAPPAEERKRRYSCFRAAARGHRRAFFSRSYESGSSVSRSPARPATGARCA